MIAALININARLSATIPLKTSRIKRKILEQI
jgi:hypothetical protein